MSDDIPSVFLLSEQAKKVGGGLRNVVKSPGVGLTKSDTGAVIVSASRCGCDGIHSIMTESPGDFRQWLRVVELGT
jgi:hypothetical protein